MVGTDLSITAQLADGTETTVTFAGGGGGGAGLTAEQVRDTIAAIMTAGAGVAITYVDDGDNAGTITIRATAATETSHGAVELATNAESLDFTVTNRAVVPRGLQHAMDNRGSDNPPEAPGTADSGTSTDFARSDHVHPEGAGGALSDADPLSVAGSPSPGTHSEGSRRDHRHALSHQDRGRVDSVDGLKAVTHDLVQTNAARTWVDSAAAGFAVFSSEPSDAELTGAAYANGTATTVQANWIGVRVTADEDARDYRAMLVLGVQTQIQGLGGQFHYRATAGGFDYYRANFFIGSPSTVTVQYHELPEGTSHYRGGVEAAKVPIDNTLQVDASKQLGVNVSEVTEHLQENVRYFTDGDTFSTTPHATKGVVYSTSPFRKSISHVYMSWSNPQGHSLALGLYRLDKTSGEILEVLYFGSGITGDPGADGEDLHFPGINQLNIPPGIDLGIALSREGGGTLPVNILHGPASADSPDVSYGNAAADFQFRHNTLLNVSDPSVGQTLGTGAAGEPWGNIRIYYRVVIDHASLVGDGNVNVDHISSGSATDGQVMKADGAGNTAWEDESGGVGGGGNSEEFLFDNHPDLVQIGTLNTVINLTTTSIVLAATPDPVPTAAGFLLIDSEVMNISAVNGSTITATRAARGTTATAHVAGVEVFYLTAANGGLGRTFQTRTWVHSTLHENRVDLGRELETGDDDAEVFIEFEYDSGGARRIGEAVIDAKTLREMHDLDRIASSTTNETFPIVMQRADQSDLTNNAVMLVHVGRRLFSAFDAANYGVVAGNDGLILGVGSGNATVATLYRVYIRVTLVHATGGASGSSGQAAEGGDGLTRISEVELLASTMNMTEYGLNTAWGAVVQSAAIEFLGFQPDVIDRIEIGLNINASFIQLVTITRQNIEQMGIVTGITGTAATTIPGVYFSGRTLSTTDSREPVELNPKLGWMNNRRLAGRYGVLLQLRHSDEGEINAILPFVSANTEIDVDWVHMVPRGAAV